MKTVRVLHMRFLVWRMKRLANLMSAEDLKQFGAVEYR